MKNAAAVAHACAGHDQTRAAHIVDCARIVCSRRRFHRLQICAQRAIANERFHLVVEKLHVLGVNVRCFDSHRTVEEDRKRFYLSGAEHFPEQQRDQLRATDGESRHKHLAAAIDCVDHDSLELRDRVCKRAMIAAAISGFQKNKIGLLEWFELAQYRRAARPKVAGENDALRFSVFLNN